MRAFLLNTKQQWEQIRGFDDHTEFRNALRTDDGVWKSGNTYIILVNEEITGFLTLEAGEVIRFHAKYATSKDLSLGDIPLFKELMDRVEAANGESVCIEDTRTGREGRHICAVETTHNEAGSTTDFILVAGFDHELEEVSYDLIQCPELGEGYFGQTSTDPDGEQFTRTSASMVTDSDSLVDYLKTVEEHITDEAKKIQDLLPPGLSPGQQVGSIIAGVTRLRPCWREEGGPWKSGEIYFYLISFTDRLYVIFNGLNTEFEDGTVRLYDGCIDYGTTVRNILDQDGVDDGFLEYYWSDPRRDDDLVVDDSGNPIRGLSPGTSVKLGYFLQTNLGFSPYDVVIGSGIYPDKNTYEPEGGMCQDIPDDLSELARGYLGEFPNFMDREPEQDNGDSGGCTIASVGEGKLKAAGLSFFLVAAVMFFGGFGGKVLRTKN